MIYTYDEIRLKNMVTTALKEKNWVKLGEVTLVRIPKIKGRTRALEPNKQGTYNIEYIYDRWYKPEIQECRNRKVVIGCVMDVYPDAMLPNDNYYKYFDIKTGLPKETEKEESKEGEGDTEAQAEEAPKGKEAPGKRKQPKAKEPPKEKPPQEEPPAAAEQTVQEEQSKKQSGEKTEKGTDKEFDKKLKRVLKDIKNYDPNWEEQLQLSGKDSIMDEVKNLIGEEAEASEIDALYEKIQKEKERARVLKYILNEIADSIKDKARKHPDGLVSAYKARKINELLIEVRVRYEGSGYEDLLELIEEPREYEQDGQKYITGMSYSDVEILLSHYTQVMYSIREVKQKKK